jgi:hypothetical protein
MNNKLTYQELENQIAELQKENEEKEKRAAKLTVANKVLIKAKEKTERSEKDLNKTQGTLHNIGSWEISRN